MTQIRHPNLKHFAEVFHFWKAGSSSLLGHHRHKFNSLVSSSYCMSLNYHTPTDTHMKHGTALGYLLDWNSVKEIKRRKRRVCVAHPYTPVRLNTAREAKSPIGFEANAAPIGSVASGPADNLTLSSGFISLSRAVDSRSSKPVTFREVIWGDL